MASGIIEKSKLTEAAKAAVTVSGITINFRDMMHAGDPALRDSDMQALKKKAQAKIEDLQQLIGSGKLDDANSQKLNAILTRLLGALQAGVISREALASALSEATTALGAADGTNKNLSPQQQAEMLWQKIDGYNKDIHGDFEKMREAGIVFNEKLWNKHQQLSEYLQAHPHDIEKQKELNAVDDQLLRQAKPQLGQCPDARPHFDDATAKSEKRHKDVAEAEAITRAKKQTATELTDADWDVPQGEDVTMNDVTAQAIARQKPEQDKAQPFKKPGRGDGGLG